MRRDLTGMGAGGETMVASNAQRKDAVVEITEGSRWLLHGHSEEPMSGVLRYGTPFEVGLAKSQQTEGWWFINDLGLDMGCCTKERWEERRGNVELTPLEGK